ncbi:MAG: hypothetical protein NT087_09410 [Deltaproteobacteria bacterium]|nr:hypothetical protein [Deltaproteobacteria bacterium]
MIHASSFWKDDLLKLANKLERRLIQTRWSEKSFFAVEKEIFLGFYSIRKLIESNKVSKSVAQKMYKIHEFPSQGKLELITNNFKSEQYDFNRAREAKISIALLCNQFIHSHYFLPFFPTGKSLLGFFICSDHRKKTGIYLITIFDIVSIYRLVGNNYPNNYRAMRHANGKTSTHVE